MHKVSLCAGVMYIHSNRPCRLSPSQMDVCPWALWFQLYTALVPVQVQPVVFHSRKVDREGTCSTSETSSHCRWCGHASLPRSILAKTRKGAGCDWCRMKGACYEESGTEKSANAFRPSGRRSARVGKNHLLQRFAGVPTRCRKRIPCAELGSSER